MACRPAPRAGGGLLPEVAYLWGALRQGQAGGGSPQGPGRGPGGPGGPPLPEPPGLSGPPLRWAPPGPHPHPLQPPLKPPRAPGPPRLHGAQGPLLRRGVWRGGPGPGPQGPPPRGPGGGRRGPGSPFRGPGRPRPPPLHRGDHRPAQRGPHPLPPASAERLGDRGGLGAFPGGPLHPGHPHVPRRPQRPGHPPSLPGGAGGAHGALPGRGVPGAYPPLPAHHPLPGAHHVPDAHGGRGLGGVGPRLRPLRHLRRGPLPGPGAGGLPQEGGALQAGLRPHGVRGELLRL